VEGRANERKDKPLTDTDSNRRKENRKDKLNKLVSRQREQIGSLNNMGGSRINNVTPSHVIL
jgi:hypothetical protein